MPSKALILPKETTGKNYAIITLLVIILLSRLFFSFTFAGKPLGDDCPRYLTTAQNILKYQVFSDISAVNPPPTSHDLPLFVFLESGVLGIFNNLHFALILISVINSIFFTVAAFGLYLLACKLFKSRRIGLFACGLFAVLPQVIIYSALQMPDSLFLALFIWSYYFLIQFIYQNNQKFLYASFALLGLSILAKPISLFFGAVAIILILIFSKEISRKKLFLLIGAGLLIEILILSPWIVRNYLTFQTLSLTTVMNENLFNYNYRIMLEDKLGKDMARQEMAEIQMNLAQQYGPLWENPFVQSRALGSFAKIEILKSVPQYILTTVRHQPRLFVGTGAIMFLDLVKDESGVVIFKTWINNPTLASFMKLPVYIILLQLISWLLLGTFYLLSISGLWILIRTKNFFPVIIFALATVYFIILTGPTLNTRYTLPILLFASPFAAVALNLLFDKLRSVLGTKKINQNE